MTPKAVYWDMDGTLIDSEPLHLESLVFGLKSLGITAPHGLHERILGVAAFPVYEMLRDEFGLRLSFEEWIPHKYTHYLENAPKLLARPGALEIFRDLKGQGVAQAVVSNSDRMVVNANMAALDLHEAGMRSIARNDVRNGKPDPEPYLRAAFLTGIAPADSVVMEDSVPGTLAGLAAGMTTIFWPETQQEGPPGALVANSADDVRRYLGLS